MSSTLPPENRNSPLLVRDMDGLRDDRLACGVCDGLRAACGVFDVLPPRIDDPDPGLGGGLSPRIDGLRLCSALARGTLEYAASKLSVRLGVTRGRPRSPPVCAGGTALATTRGTLLLPPSLLISSARVRAGAVAGKEALWRACGASGSDRAVVLLRRWGSGRPGLGL